METPVTFQLPHQKGITSSVPRVAHYIFLSREPGVSIAQTKAALKKLTSAIDGISAVIGFSAVLMKALGQSIDGLRAFPNFDLAKVDLPVTQSDVWLWLRGDDFGNLFHLSRELQALCSGVFKVDGQYHAFKHQKGHDLTGFEDGTENPKGNAALKVGLVTKGALVGSSFVAVMPWEHNFTKFDAMPSKMRNHAVGRDLQTNEELEKAPASAHVKRTAQENFSPEAFSLRRSMPWADGNKAGLMFVSFGHSFDPFEAQLKRMSGAEDGIVDGLFGFTRPMGGGFYWCPTVENSAIKLFP
jgi:porphyrinogen peroxidase